MTNPDAVKLLSDDEVAEIRARAKKYKSFAKRAATPADEEVIRWLTKQIDALCATVRALRDWKESASALLLRYDNLAETFSGEIASSKVENLEQGVAALREQLAQAETARDQLSDGLSVRDAQLAELKAQLAQVIQERDNLRDEIDGMRAALQS